VEELEGPQTSGLAIASVVAGIVWIFGLGSFAAIYLGRRSMREIAASHGEQDGRGLAIAGIWIGIAGLLGSALLVSFIVASAHH
jgi:type IV secretory pathway VirB2 component (pilin)